MGSKGTICKSIFISKKALNLALETKKGLRVALAATTIAICLTKATTPVAVTAGVIAA